MTREWQLPERRKPLTRKEYAELFLRQDGRCGQCGQRLAIKGGDEVEVIDEHVRPLWNMGSNDLSNRQLWCKPCTKPKTSGEATERAASNRVRDKFIGAKRSKTPMPGSRNHPSGLRKRMNRTVEKWRT